MHTWPRRPQETRAARNTHRDHKPEDDCSSEQESGPVCLPSCKIQASLGYSLQTSVELRDKLILEAIVHALYVPKHYFTRDLLVQSLGNVELATQNFIHWHSLTSATRCCAKEGDRVHDVRVKHVQTICTLSWLVKLSMDLKWHRMYFWIETYTIARIIH